MEGRDFFYLSIKFSTFPSLKSVRFKMEYLFREAAWYDFVFREWKVVFGIRSSELHWRVWRGTGDWSKNVLGFVSRGMRP